MLIMRGRGILFARNSPFLRTARILKVIMSIPKRFFAVGEVPQLFFGILTIDSNTVT